MNHPLASIITPIKGGNIVEIQRLIQALEKQSLSAFEALFVCDAGENTKPSIAYLQQVADHDDRFRIIIDHESAGIGGARNKGVENSRGEVIVFADSDDVPFPNFLQCFYGLLQESSSDIVVCGFLKVSNSGKEDIWLPPFDGITSGVECLEPLLTWKINNTLWNKAFKKQLLVQFPFPENCGGEDFAILPLIFLNAEKVSFSKNIVYQYNILSNSTSHSLDDFDYFTSFLFLQKRLQIARQTPCAAKTIDICIQDACASFPRAYLFLKTYGKFVPTFQKDLIGKFMRIYKKQIQANLQGRKSRLIWRCKSFFPFLLPLLSFFSLTRNNQRKIRYLKFERWSEEHESFF